MTKTKNIALIFFSRPKADEAKHKSWFKEHSKNQQIASLLIDKAQNAIKNSDIPIYHFNEENQKGFNFGERLANAYSEVFSLGYEQVISVGNDCPDLDKVNWQDINAHLAEGKSVLGPDKRGGAYLIGIQKKHFDKRKFEKLSWQKNTLYQELAQICKESTSLIELNQSRDINSFHDIRLLSKVKTFKTAFLKLISLLLQVFKGMAKDFHLTVHDFFIFKDSPLRAPPIK